MSNPREGFDQYAQGQSIVNEERAKQDAENRDERSHLRPGGLFDPARRIQPRQLVIADDETAASVVGTEQAAKRQVRHSAELEKAVIKSLAERVQNPTGPDVQAISFEEFMKYRKDPEFEPFSKYSMYITHRYSVKNAQWEVRDVPIRPFISNEVGIYRGKILYLDRMPDDSRRGDTPYVQVPAKLEEQSDPFPAKPPVENTAPAFKIVEGGKK